MTRRYQVQNTDKNQKEIIAELRKIPGVTVETGHDDILIGYRGKTYWMELKNPADVDKNGRPYKRKSTAYENQQRIQNTFTGHYSIVTTLDQILIEIGVLK